MASKIGNPLLLLLVFGIFMVAGSQETQAGYGDKPGYESQDRSVVRVLGRVICDDCDAYTSDQDSLYNYNMQRAVAGAIVSILCFDERWRAVFYTHNETDAEGNFDISLEKYKYEKYGLDGCRVKLLSSPVKTCNVVTNQGGGKSGASLDQAPLFQEDCVKYFVGPFAFTPNGCVSSDEP